MVFCSKCGKEINKDDLFCQNCGQKIITNNVKTKNTKDSNATIKNENSGTIKNDNIKSNVDSVAIKTDDVKSNVDPLNDKMSTKLFFNYAFSYFIVIISLIFFFRFIDVKNSNLPTFVYIVLFIILIITSFSCYHNIKNKRKFIYIPAGITALLILVMIFYFFTGMNIPSTNLNDFEIINLNYGWGDDSPYDNPFFWHSGEGIIKAKVSLKINSNDERLVYTIYDKIHNQYLVEYGLLNQGTNIRDTLILNMDNIYQNPQIEICASKKSSFNRYDTDKVVCKTQTFPAPKIDVSINPDSLNFIVSQYNSDYKSLIITNTGNVHSCFEFGSDYDYTKPSYGQKIGLDGRMSCLPLKPGQSESYTIQVGNTANLGTFESKGYFMIFGATVLPKDALFKKEIKLTTTVTDYVNMI